MTYSWWLKSSENLLVRKWDWDHPSHLSLSKSIKIITLMCWWPLVPDVSLISRKQEGTRASHRCDWTGRWSVNRRPHQMGMWETCWRCLVAIWVHLGSHLHLNCHIWLSKSQLPGSTWEVLSSLTQKSDACFVDRRCCKISPIFLYCEIFLPQDRLMISVGLNPESFSPFLHILCRWNNYPSALTCHLVISTTHTHTCCMIQADSHDKRIRCFTYQLLGWNPLEWSRSYLIF